MNGRRSIWLLWRRDVADRSRIETERGDDPFAVFQLEQPLNRLSVAGGRGYVDDSARVRAAEVAKERRRRLGAANKGGKHSVAFAESGGREDFDLLLAFHPPVA